MGFQTKQDRLDAIAEAAKWTEGYGHTFKTPCLDGMDVDDLGALETVFDALGLYCDHKRRAMQLRREGDIEAAMKYDRICEDVWQRLPSWAKW